MSDSININIAESIRKARELMGLSQEAACSQVEGISLRTWARIESTGKAGKQSQVILQRWLDSLPESQSKSE